MAELIVMEDGLPIFNTEYKTIPQYKKIIVNARKNKDYHGQRDLATRQFAYIWFMEDYRSTFREKFPDDEEARDEKIRNRLQLEDYDLLNQPLFIEARQIYKEDHEIIEIVALDTALLAVEQTIVNLRALVSTADDSKSVAKSSRSVIKDVKELQDSIRDIRQLREEVVRGQASLRIAGNKSKNVFEDPSSRDRTRKKEL